MSDKCNCGICLELIKANSSSIQCITCKSWVHKKCTELTADEFTKICSDLKKKVYHNWACRKCKISEVRSPQENVVEPKFDLEFHKLLNKEVLEVTDVGKLMVHLYQIIVQQGSEMRELVKEIKELKNENLIIHDMKNEIPLRNEINQLKSTKNVVDEIDYSTKIINEVNDRNVRANNIIMYNVDECTSTDVKNRIQNDNKQVLEILNRIVDEVGELKTIRIGRFNNSRPRPIKVILTNADIARKCLVNRNRLQGSNYKINDDDDLTPLQRSERSNIITKLNTRKQNGETDLILKYINGVPKIIKSAPKK